MINWLPILTLHIKSGCDWVDVKNENLGSFGGSGKMTGAQKHRFGEKDYG